MQSAIQQTIYLMESEQYDKALNACNELINSGYNHPKIFMIKAIALGKTNDFTSSQNIFNQLINSFPKNAELYYNYALILQENNQEQMALKNYEYCISLNQNHLSAINNLGVIKLIFNQVDDAKFYFEKALKIQPNNLEYTRNLANACFQLKQYSQSIKLLIKIVETRLVEEPDYILLIDSLHKNNELIKARHYYQEANSKFKNNAEILNLAGLIETDNKKYKQALIFTTKAVELDKSNLEFQINQITAESHVQLDQSIIIKKLKKLCKNYQRKANAFEFAASLCESLSDLKNTKKFLAKGFLVETNNPSLLLIKARLLSRKKKYKKSIKCLKNAINFSKSTQTKIDVTYELARTYDKTDNYKKAWKNILIANRLNQTLLVHNKVDNQFTIDSNKLITDFKENFNPIHKTPTENEKQHKPKLAFIVGFPRSGTTLIERILQAHPQIKVLEETNAINELYLKVDQLKGRSYFDKLNSLTARQIQDLRKTYMDGISDYVKWGGNETIIDKMPMNGTQLALINTLFPKAKIIFAIRHPVDVCLSCLMQNMLQVFSMNSAASVYDTYMQLVSAYTDNIKLNIFTIKYEELVADMPKQARGMLDYLELDWKDEINEFYQNKSLVNTPSYEQVSQPIYQKSKYRFKHYIKYIENDLKPLKKWVKQFGYSKLKS